MLEASSDFPRKTALVQEVDLCKRWQSQQQVALKGFEARGQQVMPYPVSSPSHPFATFADEPWEAGSSRILTTQPVELSQLLLNAPMSRKLPDFTHFSLQRA